MKQQCVVTHTVRQTDIPALLDSTVTNTPSVTKLWPQTNSFHLHFRKNITHLRVGVLRICPVILSAVKLCSGGLRQTAV